MHKARLLSRRRISAIGLAVMCGVGGQRVLADTIAFQQNANGQAYSYTFFNNGTSGPTHTDAGSFASDNDWSQAQMLSIDAYGDQYVSQPSNWSTPFYPNNVATDVQLGGSSVTLNVNVAVDTLTLNGALNILGGSMEIAGSGVTDNGSISVNSNNSFSPSVATFDGGMLTGTGTLTLSGVNSSAQLNGTLTQAVAHTISGYGQINAALTNNGVLLANGAGRALTLQTSAMTNNNLIESSNGVLSISGITLTQGTAGVIMATSGNGTVEIGGNATIVGGTLGSSGGGVVQFLADGADDTLNNVTNTGSLLIPGNDECIVVGNLVDNGTINFYSTLNSGNGNITFNGGTLSGSGTLSLVGGTLNGSLTQAAGHTIQGGNIINASLINNGTVAGGITFQKGSKTNNGIFEATSGAALSISACTINQGPNGQISAVGTSAPATVYIENYATITGGTLNSSGAGNFIFVQDGSNDTLNNVTNNTSLDIQTGIGVNGNFVDNGTITVEPESGITFGNAIVSGSGTITLIGGIHNTAGIGGTFTQAAGHTIQGSGGILPAFTNYGLVNANNPAGYSLEVYDGSDVVSDTPTASFFFLGLPAHFGDE